MRVKDGYVDNYNGRQAEVIASGSTLAIKDVCVGTILIVSGVTYMVRKAFRRGAYAYSCGLDKALSKIGCLK